ncbi:hypothetical protein PM10SUCC1_38420 [Propionigenium maris DSM 9537]|uniref:Amidinotransferase n=1 Tax=Propionigenium maris DSM 9537 TaxID=1123000 RepID=A0A9W6GNJ3_9FUSO|nr:arginine deiminase-related protein [Propionigenium maris]GLI58328.1 hypothetical protein PM10SUCC1_38420 [Propionigenium maris DSM 9537]
MKIDNHSQITDTILMVKPVSFGYNPQTAVNNYYQKAPSPGEGALICEGAIREFNRFVDTLKEKGIRVIVVEDTPEPATPDSIFPNNWISFHREGIVALYSMFAENRRLERRKDILDTLKGEGVDIRKIIDYSPYEDKNIYLEGTGSMVLDRINRKAYCALSPRASLPLLNKFCEDFGYTPVAFSAYQWAQGKRLPIYHTNVLMALGEDFAIICSQAIDDPLQRKKVLDELKGDGRVVIDITEEQVESFAGNALQVRSSAGNSYLVMSRSALEILTPYQIKLIEERTEILSIDIGTIERYGGGSVRCMMAEVF